MADAVRIDIAEYRAALVRARLTQRALAQSLEMGEVTLSNVVRGARPLAPTLLARIAARLDVPVEFLIERPAPPDTSATAEASDGR